MNRRNFLKFSGYLLANTIFIPIVKKGNAAMYYIESSDDFFAMKNQTLEPGAIVYFREGIYKLRDQQESVAWTGTEEESILVRPYKNEEVIIDGSINPQGDHQHWYGFEIFNSRWLTRNSIYPHGNNPDIGPIWEAFNNDADGTIIENCVIHDCRQGLRLIGDNNITVKNCVIYNNGFHTTPDGYAHEIYWNGDGLILEGNVIISGEYSAWGLHGYGGEMHNLICKNNVFINGSCMTRSSNNMTNIQMIGNEIIGVGQFTELEVGMEENGHSGVIVKDNYIVDGRLRIRSVADGEIKNNIVATKYNPAVYKSWPDNTLVWDENEYYRQSDLGFIADGVTKTFEQWQTDLGFDLNSDLHNIYPFQKRTRIIETSARTITIEYGWPQKSFDLYLSDMNLGLTRDAVALKKLYPGVHELNQEYGNLVVRLPPAPYAAWMKEIEDSVWP